MIGLGEMYFTNAIIYFLNMCIIYPLSLSIVITFILLLKVKRKGSINYRKTVIFHFSFTYIFYLFI